MFTMPIAHWNYIPGGGGPPPTFTYPVKWHAYEFVEGPANYQAYVQNPFTFDWFATTAFVSNYYNTYNTFTLTPTTRHYFKDAPLRIVLYPADVNNVQAPLPYGSTPTVAIRPGMVDYTFTGTSYALTPPYNYVAVTLDVSSSHSGERTHLDANVLGTPPVDFTISFPTTTPNGVWKTFECQYDFANDTPSQDPADYTEWYHWWVHGTIGAGTVSPNLVRFNWNHYTCFDLSDGFDASTMVRGTIILSSDSTNTTEQGPVVPVIFFRNNSETTGGIHQNYFWPPNVSDLSSIDADNDPNLELQTDYIRLFNITGDQYSGITTAAYNEFTSFGWTGPGYMGWQFNSYSFPTVFLSAYEGYTKLRGRGDRIVWTVEACHGYGSGTATEVYTHPNPPVVLSIDDYYTRLQADYGTIGGTTTDPTANYGFFHYPWAWVVYFPKDEDYEDAANGYLNDFQWPGYTFKTDRTNDLPNDFFVVKGKINGVTIHTFVMMKAGDWTAIPPYPVSWV